MTQTPSPHRTSAHDSDSDEDLDAFLSEIKSIEKEIPSAPESEQKKVDADEKQHAATTSVIGPAIPTPQQKQEAPASIGPTIPEEFLNRRKRKAEDSGIGSSVGSLPNTQQKKRRILHPSMVASGRPTKKMTQPQQLSAKPKIISEAERAKQFKERYEALNREATQSTRGHHHESDAHFRRNDDSWHDPYSHQNYESIKRNMDRDNREHQLDLASGETGSSEAGSALLKDTTTFRESNKKVAKRTHGGETWEDSSLLDWPENDYRIFVGNLPPDVTNEVLLQAFSRYKSVAKVHVVKNRKTDEPKGYGFVSMLDAEEYVNALDTMDGEYIGSRMVQLRPSKWKKRVQEK